MRIVRRRGWIMWILLALACREPLGTPVPVEPRLVVVRGDGVTAAAGRSDTLVVQLFGSDGRPESGVLVTFAAPQGDCRWSGDSPCVRVHVGKGTVITDSAGRAATPVRMGSWAVPGIVTIVVPVYALSATAHFNIVPDSVWRIRPEPYDTFAEVGLPFRNRTATEDGWYNPRDDAITFESSDPAILRVDATGTVTGVAPGRAAVRLRATVAGANLADSSMVTVVPAARLAVTGEFTALRLVSIAGGGGRTLVPAEAEQPAWSPAGDRLVYVTPAGLVVTDTLGNGTVLPTAGVGNQLRPQYSRDGQWIYFQGWRSWGKLFRVHPDGTGLESLLEQSAGEAPSPAPDGQRLAYISSAARILDLRTGETSAVPGADDARRVLWSPDGTWLACATDNGELYLIHPDGSGKRTLATWGWREGVTWSPDSHWLLGSVDGHLTLVEIATGARTTLPVDGLHVAWRP